MTFYIEKGREGIVSTIRKIGYILTPYSLSVEEEFNFIKPLSRQNYPRFHLYIKEDHEKGSYSFNLHLDQKKTSYGNHTMHSGEYDGEVIEREAERIKKILK